MAQAGAEVTWRGLECCCSLRSASALSIQASLLALQIAAHSVSRGEEEVARAPVEKTARAVWRALGGGTSISCDAEMAEQERDLRDCLAELRQQNGFNCQVRACLARVLALLACHV